MKGKKPLCGEFCKYYCQNFVIVFFFPRKLTNLINYSFWMTVTSSFRLKTYFKGEGHSKNCVFFFPSPMKSSHWVELLTVVLASEVDAIPMKKKWKVRHWEPPFWKDLERQAAYPWRHSVRIGAKLSFSVLNSFIQLWAKMLGPGL